VEEKKRVYLEADIKVQKETESLRKAAASVIDLPSDKEKQPDLLYFSAIFVSSGENLNHAYFLPSELISAEHTIVNKALDVEHKEDEIIGHLYDREFMDDSGNKVSLDELASSDEVDSSSKKIHIAVAGIIYKSRFPNIAQEVADGKWKVSMEAYFTDYDVKIGDLIISKDEAESLGLAKIESKLGSLAKVLKKGKEIAEGHVTRVLKGILFSGCGIVENPANPPSIILETAKNKDKNRDEDGLEDIVIILDYDKLDEEAEEEDNKLTLSKDEGKEKEESELEHQDTVGICVYFKRRVTDSTTHGPDTEVIHENWCTKFNQSCTSFSRDTTDPDCLLNSIKVKSGEVSKMVKIYAEKLLAKKKEEDVKKELLNNLTSAMGKAEKIL
jgi:hypothetical protein